MSLLSLEKVDKIFGGLSALKQVSFDVPERAIFGLIGPNGAGKTTLFNVITGVYSPDGGVVRFEGQSIGGQSPARVAHRGIARTSKTFGCFGP
jgi:branched-chain amino acid transport system ATP-binding protein